MKCVVNVLQARQNSGVRLLIANAEVPSKGIFVLSDAQSDVTAQIVSNGVMNVPGEWSINAKCVCV